MDEMPNILAQFAARTIAAGEAGSVSAVDERKPEPDVEGHLRALDDEIARLRRMEAALDRRIAEADDERRAIEERMEDGD